jgi:hypothetical protein
MFLVYVNNGLPWKKYNYDEDYILLTLVIPTKLLVDGTPLSNTVGNISNLP